MQYTTGKTGRIIVARLEDGEPIYEKVEEIAKKEDIRFAQVTALGGLRRAKVVVGPKSTEGKIEPITREFDDAREVLGVGTLAWDEEGPKLHLHSAIGRQHETLVGCTRIQADVYLVLEVVITEIVGIAAERKPDPESGAKLLEVGSA